MPRRLQWLHAGVIGLFDGADFTADQSWEEKADVFEWSQLAYQSVRSRAVEDHNDNPRRCVRSLGISVKCDHRVWLDVDLTLFRAHARNMVSHFQRAS